MRLSVARTTTLLLTLAAAATSFVPELLEAAPTTLITLDAPTAPSAVEVAAMRASVEGDADDASALSTETWAGALTRSTSVTTGSSKDEPALSNTSSTPSLESAPGHLPPRPRAGGYQDEFGEEPVFPAPNLAPANSSPSLAPAARTNDPLLVSTVGDSSMMFMNAALAAALGPERWQPVPTEFARWTDGTGGFDRHGCGPTGDSMRIFFSQSVGPLEPQVNHPDELEQTCDWRRWIPGGLALARTDVVVASWGPTSMWGWERDDRMVDLTDPVIRQSVAAAYAEVRAAMLVAGVQEVVWVAYPAVVWRPFFDRNREEQPWSRPAVADELYAILTELGDPVVDLRDMADPSNFADGLHFTDAASAIAAQRVVAALPDIVEPSAPEPVSP